MKITLSLSGVDQAITVGNVIATRVTEAIQKAVDEGAKDVQKREQELAPIMQKPKKGAYWQGSKGPGYLRRSIVIQKGKYGITKMVRAKAPHAHFQEFGTARGVKPLYFAQRAKDQVLPWVEANIRASIEREVNQ
ncbi:MAG: HK97 gp10 family phage protein [Negativicutes bacterium]|nr:HK97 gp10 family phage protein [Negativicutes bacterium]